MAENTVKLERSGLSAEMSDLPKSIIRQASDKGTTSSENGRRRIREAAEIRNNVSKRMKLIGE